MIAREVIKEQELAGEKLKAGTQVVVANSFDHLVDSVTAHALTFDPPRWQQPPEGIHNFEGGAQRCPGEDALLLAKGVKATWLENGRYHLVRSREQGAERLPKSLNPFALGMKHGA